LPKGRPDAILSAMKSQTATIILTLVCAGLAVGWLWSEKRAARERSEAEAAIGNYSNKWVETSASLDQLRQVNTSLEGDLRGQRASYQDLTNAYSRLSSELDQTAASLKTANETIARRDSKIADLESQNQELDQRALDLGLSITNLTAQINETRRKLAASEGDKAFLEKELQRLMAEKAELERQFNDLTVLRAQVSKLKEEMTIARRLEWIRQGLFARLDQRGAEQLTKRTSPPSPSAQQHNYDLNVEISADGTVRVVGPAPGYGPNPSQPPPASSVPTQ
jgi:chromosome segregation ATPase